MVTPEIQRAETERINLGQSCEVEAGVGVRKKRQISTMSAQTSVRVGYRERLKSVRKFSETLRKIACDSQQLWFPCTSQLVQRHAEMPVLLISALHCRALLARGRKRRLE